MARLTLKDRLIRYLKLTDNWVASGTMQRMVAEKTTYTPQTTGRLLRELHEEGILDVKYIKNHAHYRYITDVVPYNEQKAIEWFDSLPDKKPEGAAVKTVVQRITCKRCGVVFQKGAAHKCEAEY
jgi:hypothetical protein